MEKSLAQIAKDGGVYKSEAIKAVADHPHIHELRKQARREVLHDQHATAAAIGRVADAVEDAVDTIEWQRMDDADIFDRLIRASFLALVFGVFLGALALLVVLGLFR